MADGRGATGPILDVRGVGRSFGGLEALADVSFSIERGTIHGVIGPNGAGKTTLFNIITAIIPPSSGSVAFDGTTITGLPPYAIARLGIARTFQNVRLFGEQTALENVIVGTYRHTRTGLIGGLVPTPRALAEQRRTREEAVKCLRYVGLADLAERPVVGLPFGQQRLLEFARALALRPVVLLLDEPAAGLNDHETEALAEVIGSLPSRGITVVLVEHNMNLIMGVADRIVVLDHGMKLAEGTPAEIRADPRVISAYLGNDSP